MTNPAPRSPPVAPNVVLVSMPWTTVMQPSLGLAVLCAELRGQGIACRAWHANLLLLKHLRPETYSALAQSDILNEFLFTALIDSVDEHQYQALRTRCGLLCDSGRNPPGYECSTDLFELILALRNQVIPAFVAECAERILAMEPTMVGFTCLFDQTIASANVAKLLKQARPDLPILLGGYAVQYENGLEVLRAFPWIDAIARGEGEPVIAPIARATAAGEDLSALPGVLTRERPFLTPLVPRADLRLSQPPDYDDWFADLAALEDEEQVALRTEALPIESSRGCWWGQRSHCTFCGIDEDTLKYRAKPPEQILAEIRHLRARYGTDHPLRFADYILPHHYHDTLLPALARLDPLPHLEAEMKANQTRERLQAFARAGFIALQPGIESFSTPVLKRMAKGVRAIQNVQLLKWGHLDRVVINYNLLFGFPGDQAAEYRWLVEHMPRLYHLIPPVSRAEVALTRFAPLFEDPERFGLPGRAPAHSYYRLLFSDAFLQETGFTLDNYAYYFDRNYTFSLELAELYAQLVIQVAHWKARHLSHHVTLAYVRRGEDYVFLDTRFDAREAFELKGPAARLYALCDDQAIAVEEAIVRAGAEGLSRAEVEQAIDTLDRYRVIWHSDGMMIGLGIPMEVATLRFRECWHLTWPSLAPLVRGQAPPAPLDLERSGEHVLA